MRFPPRHRAIERPDVDADTVSRSTRVFDPSCGAGDRPRANRFAVATPRAWLCGCVLVLSIALAAPSFASETESPVDLNRASAAELEAKLVGVGAVKAAAIVAWRDANGGFASVDRLIDVPGIGPVTLERLRPQVTLGQTRGLLATRRETETRAAVQRVLTRAHDAARRAALRR